VAVVRVDERGRITLPRGLGVRGGRAVIIPAGSFFVVIPLPERPVEVSGGWLPSEKGRDELKAMAEELARRDAVKRARRRGQL